MSIGFGRTKADLDVRMGTIVVNIRDALKQAAAMKALLDNTNIFANDQALIDLGYSAGEVTTIRAAFTALNTLNSVANGNAAQTPANNFFFDAQKLTGVVL